jgi:hypothetical protein
MDYHQTHLSQLLEQRKKLQNDVDTLNNQATRTKELFFKTQGAIEYLEAIGTKLPEPESAEVTEEAEAAEEEAKEEAEEEG